MGQLQWTLCARVIKGSSDKLKETTDSGEDSYYFCETSPPSDDQHQGSPHLKKHTSTIIAEMWHNITGSGSSYDARIKGIKDAIRKLLINHLSPSSDVW